MLAAANGAGGAALRSLARSLTAAARDTVLRVGWDGETTSSRQLLPGLHPAVRGFVSYYDAKVSHPERIAFEVVAGGLAANPDCLALNHCEFDRHRAGEVPYVID